MVQNVSAYVCCIGILVLLPVIAFAQDGQFTTNLKRESSGKDVARLQEFLKTLPDVYPEGLVTGYFGLVTEKAVKRFQKKYGLEQVGVVGPKTREKLNNFGIRTPQTSRRSSQQKGSPTRQKTQVTQRSKDEERQATPSLAARFVGLEKELLEAKSSGAHLAPAHYDRIRRDLDTLHIQGYSAGEIERLRAITITLSPHVKDKLKDTLAITPQSATQETTKREAKTLMLKNLGVNFETWDKNTNRAGAFIFLPSEKKLFLEYGAEVESSEGGTKVLPTFEYRTAPDADVFAAIDGVITNITYQERNQDYSIHIQPELNSQWILEQDHVRDLKISKGDSVQAGDFLGKVGTLNSTLGRTEIMIWSASGSRPLTYCPFKYFDPGLASNYQQKVTQHMKDWEEFKGNQSLYGEETHALPGCVQESILD